MDSHLARCRQLTAPGGGGPDGPSMARLMDLQRDLQGLREWYDRTSKPRLRQAIIRKATEVMKRMDRHLTARSLAWPDLHAA